MTVITGPVISERKISAPAVSAENAGEKEAPPALHNAEENKPKPPTLPPQAEQNKKEIPCFTAPAPVRRRRTTYFGTVAAQLFIAMAVGGAFWLGLSFGGEAVGSAVRSTLEFLLNG